MRAMRKNSNEGRKNHISGIRERGI